MTLCSPEEYYYKLDNILLSCAHHLRILFKKRYKVENGQEWIDSREYIQNFMNGPGKAAYKIAKKHQKTALNASNSIEDWDTTMLSLLIQNFGGESQAYVKENEAVRNLKTMRNKLAHHKSKKVCETDYNEKVLIIRQSLESIGVTKKKIDVIIESAGVTSSLEAWDCVKQLHAKANHYLEKGRSQDAATCYSEAIQVPSLLPDKLGIAYEKRAEYTLTLIKDALTDKEFCESALIDATKAVELNDSSWNAHYLTGQCYRWKNDISEAILHHERALAISPKQSQVKNDLDGCKVLAGIYEREDHLNPGLMPMNFEEHLEYGENLTGRKWCEEQYFYFKGEVEGKLINGQNDAFLGHKYFNGWSVPKDFKEAVKYYTKAASVKNTDGMYSLANCYHYGHGVKQNVQKSLQIYKELAEMEAKPNIGNTTLKKMGVAEAQHVLGILYSSGIGVEKDSNEAAVWYHKAMDGGVGTAANNLGLLYQRGEGVLQDNKMAEMCWKQAIQLKNPIAPANLMAYYIHELELEQAETMLQIGRQLGNSRILRMTDDEFYRCIETPKRQRNELEPRILEFEKTMGLPVKGLTFQQRVSRHNDHVNENINKMKKVVDDFLHDRCAMDWGGKVQGLTSDSLTAIRLRATAGSKPAQRVMETIASWVTVKEMLETGARYSEAETLEIVDLLYTCATLDVHLLLMTPAFLKKIKTLLARLFEKYGDKTGPADMKIRFSYATFNLYGNIESKDMFDVEVLKEGCRRYSDNINYYQLLSDVCGSKGQWDTGLYYVKEGLKLCPDNPNLLYDYACHILHKVRYECTPECIAAYKKYLSVAAKDDRKLPDAWYALSWLYFKDKNVAGGCDDKRSISNLVIDTFQRGQDAEKDQLPCYLPYGKSDIRTAMEVVVSTMKMEGAPSSSRSPSGSGSAKSCDEKISVLKRKEYLMSPTRTSLISTHRETLREASKMVPSKGGHILQFFISAPPKLKQTRAKKVSLMKSITLRDMNPTVDQIFENRIIDLVIIDDPNPHLPSIDLIAEDENGDITRLFIYNVEKSKDNLKRLSAGCKIAIMNPYMRIGVTDFIPSLRNDEPNCIVYLNKVENMCRFCGDENAKLKCAHCKRPFCSVECLELDLELKHDLICSLKMKM